MRALPFKLPVVFFAATLAFAGMACADDANLAETQKQATAGNPQAQVAWGKHLASSKDPATRASATEWFRKPAAQGDHEAEWMLGSAYMGGIGVERDTRVALDWMRKSVADGNPDRMANFGFALITTNALGAPSSDGVDWLKRSVAAGSTRGMLTLGMLHLSGFPGVTKDAVEAEQLIRKAAELGFADAQAGLGILYMSDMLGTPKPTEGVRWLDAAANQGHVESQGTLAYFLISGERGVTKDPARGVIWAEKAVAQHGAQGYYALGLAYFYGEGERRDAAEAWYNLAVADRLDTKHQFSKASDLMSQAATQLNTGDLDRLRARVEKIPKPANAS